MKKVWPKYFEKNILNKSCYSHVKQLQNMTPNLIDLFNVDSGNAHKSPTRD